MGATIERICRYAICSSFNGSFGVLAFYSSSTFLFPAPHASHADDHTNEYEHGYAHANGIRPWISFDSITIVHVSSRPAPISPPAGRTTHVRLRFRSTERLWCRIRSACLPRSRAILVLPTGKYGISTILLDIQLEPILVPSAFASSIAATRDAVEPKFLFRLSSPWSCQRWIRRLVPSKRVNPFYPEFPFSTWSWEWIKSPFTAGYICLLSKRSTFFPIPAGSRTTSDQLEEVDSSVGQGFAFSGIRARRGSRSAQAKEAVFVPRQLGRFTFLVRTRTNQNTTKVVND
jgi:hypothetical protein